MTIDKTRLPRPAGTKAPLPSFTPVPRQSTRHDGWTPERQLGFIEALADTGSVKAAAHRVNMTPEGAYLLRRHGQAVTFRKAWEAALALGVQQLEDIAMERALYGCEVPVYSYGKLIGSRIVHNDRLLMFMLRNRAPTRFAADGRVTARRGSIGDPHDAARLGRLKKQWRKEWDEERSAEARVKSQAVIEGINAKLQSMADRREAATTPRTRALYLAWQEAQQADEAAGRNAWNCADEDQDGGADEDQDGEQGGDREAAKAGDIALPPARPSELSDHRADHEQDQ